MVEMRERAINVIGQERAGRAALFPLRSEHEMVDDQLAVSVEKIGKRQLAVRSVEGIWFFNPLPGQLTPRTAELIPQLCKLLLFSSSSWRDAIH